MITFRRERIVHVLLWCLFASASLVRGNKTHTYQSTEIFNDLIRNYDKNAPPDIHSPTVTKIGLYINSYDVIQTDHNADFTFTGYFRVSWKDPRLKFPSNRDSINEIRGPEDGWSKIWIPDVFMRGSKTFHVHESIGNNRLLKVKNDGLVWFVSKVTVTTPCRFDLGSYPFDTLSCPLNIESFGYHADTLSIQPMEKPVEFASDGSSSITIESVTNTDCTETYTSGTFSCLELNFKLLRKGISFFPRTFTPCLILVILSWITFWIDYKKSTTRLLIGFLTLIALILIDVQGRSGRPSGSSYSLVDKWFLVCYFFVFISILEYCVVVVLSRVKTGSGAREWFLPIVEKEAESDKSVAVNDGRRKALWVDWLSRIIFPVAFLIFVVTLLISSHSHKN